ncbi:unnamed protein product [Rhizoctonia solani]|nr:unnamed protein product [Rhizoctonia solani]
MTAFAGFYVNSEAWTNWLHSQPNCPPWVCATIAEDLIERALHEKKVDKYFSVELVPIPPSEPDYKDGARGIMLIRRSEPKRAYIPPRPDSKCDLTGQEMIKQLIGLEVSEWKTMWYNEKSHEPPYGARFLNPRTTGRNKTKKKARSAVKSRVKRTTKDVDSSKEGEDQGEKDTAEEMDEDQIVQAKDGKADDEN